MRLLLQRCLPVSTRTACKIHAYLNVVVFVIIVVASVWMSLLPEECRTRGRKRGCAGAKRRRAPKPHRPPSKPHRPARQEMCGVCPAALTCPALPCCNAIVSCAALCLCAVLPCSVLRCARTWAGCEPCHARWWQALSPAMCDVGRLQALPWPRTQVSDASASSMCSWTDDS